MAIKTTIKKAIGGGLKNLMLWPTAASCLASAGYYITQDDRFKSAIKMVDVMNNQLFAKHAEAARAHTMLGNDRLHVIYQCLNQSCDKDAVVMEVGCYKGGTSLFMANVLNETTDGKFELHAFDTFEGHVEQDIGVNDNAHKAGYFNDAKFEDVVSLLSGYKQAYVHKGRVQDSIKDIDKKLISFIHLDTDLYEPTRFVLNMMDGRMRMLDIGMIVVDDYGARSCDGVKRAVDEYITGNDCRMLALPTGQAVLFR